MKLVQNFRKSKDWDTPKDTNFGTQPKKCVYIFPVMSLDPTVTQERDRHVFWVVSQKLCEWVRPKYYPL